VLSLCTIVSDDISERIATPFVKTRVFSLSHRGSGKKSRQDGIFNKDEKLLKCVCILLCPQTKNCNVEIGIENLLMLQIKFKFNALKYILSVIIIYIYMHV
jgi:hypothetical protein